MNIADQNNEGEIFAATRERIAEFSRELALALKRIFSETQNQSEFTQAVLTGIAQRLLTDRPEALEYSL